MSRCLNVLSGKNRDTYVYSHLPQWENNFYFLFIKKNFFFNVDHFFKSLVNFVTKILFCVLVFWPRHVGF